MTTTNKLIQRWTRPDSYAGANWPEHFIFLRQHRDSDALSRSNFVRGLELIGEESETVLVVRERHWAYGWVEWIAIHESDAQALAKAEAILKALEAYPVVDEDHFSQLEWDEAAEYWAGMSVEERAEYCHNAGVSVFAARHAYLPSDDTGALMELLRG
jgi:hypothetical protein